VSGDEEGHSVATERLAATGREQRVVGAALSFLKPGTNDGDGVGGERGAPLLTSFAEAADVRPGSELDVSAAEPDEFGDPQPGLEGDEEQGVIAAADPSAAVGGGEKGGGLGSAEEAHLDAVGSFGRDGKHPLDERGVLGMAQGSEAEQRVHRGEPSVAGADGVAAPVLEMVEEGADEAGVEVFELQG
jgi:hypothetical protein